MIMIIIFLLMLIFIHFNQSYQNFIIYSLKQFGVLFQNSGYYYQFTLILILPICQTNYFDFTLLKIQFPLKLTSHFNQFFHCFIIKFLSHLFQIKKPLIIPFINPKNPHDHYFILLNWIVLFLDSNQYSDCFHLLLFPAILVVTYCRPILVIYQKYHFVV